MKNLKIGITVTYFNSYLKCGRGKEKKVSILKESTDQCLSIIPFEQEWFEKHNVKTSFIGHPFIN